MESLTLVQDRLTICAKCDSLLEDRTCALCACPIDTKTAMLDASCPDRKW